MEKEKERMKEKKLQRATQESTVQVHTIYQNEMSVDVLCVMLH